MNGINDFHLAVRLANGVRGLTPIHDMEMTDGQIVVPVRGFSFMHRGVKHEIGEVMEDAHYLHKANDKEILHEYGLYELEELLSQDEDEEETRLRKIANLGDLFDRAVYNAVHECVEQILDESGVEWDALHEDQLRERISDTIAEVIEKNLYPGTD